MELSSYKSYIDNLVADNFKLETFSPEKIDELFNIFMKSFYCDTPYWKKATEEGDRFYIEFKKYGENRKRVFLKFSFISNAKTPRIIGLTLTNEDLKEIDKMAEISLSDVWRDHSILANHLKDAIGKGLNLAEEIY